VFITCQPILNSESTNVFYLFFKGLQIGFFWGKMNNYIGIFLSIYFDLN